MAVSVLFLPPPRFPCEEVCTEQPVMAGTSAAGKGGEGFRLQFVGHPFLSALRCLAAKPSALF